jgi:hypothetical protein
MKQTGIIVLGGAFALAAVLYASVDRAPAGPEGGLGTGIFSTASREHQEAVKPSPTVDGAPDSGQAPSVSVSTEALQEELRLLGRDLAELTTTVAALSRDMQRMQLAIGDSDAIEEEGPARYEDAVAEEEWRHREELAALEGAFRREPVDRSWSAATRDRIESALDAVSLSEQVRALECRAATCRIEIAARGSPGDPGFEAARGSGSLPQLVMMLGNTLPAMTAFELDDEGPVPGTLLYLSRDTDSIP